MAETNTAHDGGHGSAENGNAGRGNGMRLEACAALADVLRWHVLQSTAEAGSGHPTSCFSCAEIVAVLFARHLRFDVDNPDHPANDRFVLSKGHAAPILWAAWAEAGGFPTRELATLRRHDSDLEGHPTPRNEFVDVATGSLGQGLSNALGMAIASRFRGMPNRVFALLGDGELAEGAVWEAAALASHRHVDNLVAIVDVNALGQTGQTMQAHDLDVLARRFEAFGWHAQSIDGHDVGALDHALREAVDDEGRPAVILAQTIKGKGVSFLEGAEGRHGKPLDGDELDKARQELGGLPTLARPVHLAPPPDVEDGETRADPKPVTPLEVPKKPLATRKAYGDALVRLGARHPGVVVLDGEVGNSTHAEKFAARHPSRFVEAYIAEQNLVGMACGMSALHWTPFVSSFAAFLSRAHDFIRMAAVSRANVRLCGSHAGVSIGEDGPSQMGLEDIAMMRALPGSTVLYPADAVATHRLVDLAAGLQGIVYLRTTRPDTEPLYDADTPFRTGGSHVLRSSDEDEATLVGAGITVYEALKAHDELARQGIPTRVVDAYSVKPLDESTLLQAARDTGLVVTVEDHYAEGGLGEAVAAALAGRCALRVLAVRQVPRSGASDRLLATHGIDAAAIAGAVRSGLGERRPTGSPS